jgi:hypothetical protein
VKLNHQPVDRHHNQEVKSSGDEDKCDQDVEKLTVLDDTAVTLTTRKEKSGLCTIAAMRGLMISVTSALTIAVNAAPITTATARSTTLPRKTKVAKSFKHGVLLIREFTRPVCPKILREREQAPPSYALYRLRTGFATCRP